MLDRLSHAIRAPQATITPLNLPLGRPDAQHALSLILAQPCLLGLSQHALAEKVDEVADHDEDKGDRVQVVDGVSKDAQADDDAPEVARQQADVEEGGRGESVQDGH